jgi:hypothetical protein
MEEQTNRAHFRDDSLDDEPEATSPSLRNAMMMPPYYPSNIAAACQAASAVQDQPKSMSTKDAIELEMRRKSNRLSAQRWRMRKRSKFADLQDEIHALKKEHEELSQENSALQAEFRTQVVLAQAETAHLLSAQTTDARVHSARRSLFAFRDPGMGASDRLDLLTRMPDSHVDRHMLAAFTTPSALCLQASRDELHYRGLQLPVGSVWPTNTSWESSEIGGRVTHDDLTAALRSATAPSHSSMR